MDRLISAVAKVGGTLLTKAMPLSKKAVEIVAEAFGVSEDNPDALALAIEKDPDAAVKIAEIQSTTKVELQRIILQSDVAHLEDRQDARDREIALAKISRNLYLCDYGLKTLVFGIFGFMVVATWAWGLPDVNEIVIGALIAGVITLVKDVAGYQWGSSKKGNSNDTAGGAE